MQSTKTLNHNMNKFKTVIHTVMILIFVPLVIWSIIATFITVLETIQVFILENFLTAIDSIYNLYHSTH